MEGGSAGHVLDIPLRQLDLMLRHEQSMQELDDAIAEVSKAGHLDGREERSPTRETGGLEVLVAESLAGLSG